MKYNFKKSKKGQMILTYINVGISFAAIIVSIFSLIINNKEQKQQEYEAYPSFNIVTKQHKGIKQDQLINVKGFVNNLSFKKFELLTIMLPDAKIRISYQCASSTKEVKHNTWLIDSPCTSEIGSKIKNAIYRLQNNYNVKIDNVITETYYKITYQDYKNLEQVHFYNKDYRNDNIIRLVNNDYLEKIDIHTVFIRDWDENQIDSEVKDKLELIEQYQQRKGKN